MATEEEKLRYAEKHYGTKEKDIEEKAYAYAKSRGVWHTKFKSANNRGLPDRIFIAPGNVVFFIEFKRPKKTARKDQKLVIEEMQEFGAKIFVTDNLDRAKQIIDDMVTFGDAE